MDKYRDEQLFDILSARVKWGLNDDIITNDQLYRVADAAAGDARLAIGILRTAAGKADRENYERITDDILLDAAEDARAQIKQKSLDSLTPHQRVVYDIVRKHGPIGPSEIHDRYTEEIENPRTKRTVRTYLSKWNVTTSSRRRGQVGIENTRSSIPQLRCRCSNRVAISYPELNSPRPDCSWSSGSMTRGSSLPGLLTCVEIS